MPHAPINLLISLLVSLTCVCCFNDEGIIDRTGDKLSHNHSENSSSVSTTQILDKRKYPAESSSKSTNILEQILPKAEQTDKNRLKNSQMLPESLDFETNFTSSETLNAQDKSKKYVSQSAQSMSKIFANLYNVKKNSSKSLGLNSKTKSLDSSVDSSFGMITGEDIKRFKITHSKLGDKTKTNNSGDQHQTIENSKNYAQLNHSSISLESNLAKRAPNLTRVSKNDVNLNDEEKEGLFLIFRYLPNVKEIGHKNISELTSKVINKRKSSTGPNTTNRKINIKKTYSPNLTMKDSSKLSLLWSPMNMVSARVVENIRNQTLNKNETRTNILHQPGGKISANNTLNTTASTLPSIYKENLIPPIPNDWAQNNLNDNTGSTRQTPSDVIRTISKPRANKNYGKSDLFTEPNTTNPVMNLTMKGPIKRTISYRKASTERPKTEQPFPKERINFVTLPPSAHWRLWEYAERAHVDPFFDINTANMTRDVTQVYTAYWTGSVNPTYREKGIWVLRIGSGIALLTLIITITAQSLKYCQPHLCQKAILITNLATSLAAAHLVFIFGIEATKGIWTCGVISLLLHFLHLLSCNWILALSIRLLRSLLQKSQISTVAFCAPVWFASIITVVVSYACNPAGYETQQFCWLSVEKGMLIAFIAPVCTLLIVNAGICVAAQKVLLDAGVKGDPMDKADMRASVILLPLQSIAWFLAIIALEDEFSLALDCAAAISTALVGILILNFYVPGWVNVYEEISCSLPHPFKTKDRELYLQSEDIAQLPLIQEPMPQTTVCTCNASLSPAILEEFQLEPLYVENERKNAY